MARKKITYEELCKASVSEARNLVISSCSEGGYTLAQQLVTKEGKHEVSVFLKGAIHIKDTDALIMLRDALNVAIKKGEEIDTESYWDED